MVKHLLRGDSCIIHLQQSTPQDMLLDIISVYDNPVGVSGPDPVFKPSLNNS